MGEKIFASSKIFQCILESKFIDNENFAFLLTSESTELLKAKSSLVALLEQAMTESVSSNFQRYITATFCPGQRPRWQCNDVFTRSFFLMADPLKDIFNCAKTATKCDYEKYPPLELAYDPRYYHRSLLYVLNTSYNLDFLQDMLRISQVLASLDITSYCAILVFWVAVIVYGKYTSQKSMPISAPDQDQKRSTISREAEMLNQGFDHHTEIEHIALQSPKDMVEQNEIEQRDGPTISPSKQRLEMSNKCVLLKHKKLRH